MMMNKYTDWYGVRRAPETKWQGILGYDSFILKWVQPTASSAYTDVLTDVGNVSLAHI
jgi:hypothetical protein